MLLRHALSAVAVPACLGNIQRIHSRSRIGLWEDCVCVAMATGARMVLRIRVHASSQARCLIRVAARALHLRYLVRMRILLDVSVAIVALQAAMNALAKGLSVHSNAVPIRILHGRVAMAREALGLRMQPARTHRQQQCRKPGNQQPVAHPMLRPAETPWTLPTV